MTKKDFSKRIIRCSGSYWGAVLIGARNLGYDKADTVSKILNTNRDLWMNPRASVNDRQNAWEKFSKGDV